MVLQVTTANNVKVYTVSGGLGSRSIPDWLVRQKKKALKKDFGKKRKLFLTSYTRLANTLANL